MTNYFHEHLSHYPKPQREKEALSTSQNMFYNIIQSDILFKINCLNVGDSRYGDTSLHSFLLEIKPIMLLCQLHMDFLDFLDFCNHKPLGGATFAIICRTHLGFSVQVSGSCLDAVFTSIPAWGTTYCNVTISLWVVLSSLILSRVLFLLLEEDTQVLHHGQCDTP